MRRVLLLSLLLLVSLPASATDSLDAFEWTARLFVIFADDRASEAFQVQETDMTANAAGFLDRDLIVFVFEGNRLVESRPAQSISPDGATIRKRLRLPETGFAAALVGYDGGVAIRSLEPVDACSLFREIDGMPIRQSEMARRGGSVPCRKGD